MSFSIINNRIITALVVLVGVIAGCIFISPQLVSANNNHYNDYGVYSVDRYLYAYEDNGSLVHPDDAGSDTNIAIGYTMRQSRSDGDGIETFFYKSAYDPETGNYRFATQDNSRFIIINENAPESGRIGGEDVTDSNEATVHDNRDLANAVLDGTPVTDSTISPPGQSTEDQEGGQPDRTCEDIGGWAWAFCPLTKILDSALDFIDGQVQRLLLIEERRYGSDELRDAWSVVRNIAYILLVPAMLLMVIGTALGFEFVSAYTVKKALPRMVAAAIFIAFSFEIAVFAIQVTNALGTGIRGIMTTPFGIDGAFSLSSLLGVGDHAIAGGWIVGGAVIAAAISLGPGGAGLLATLGAFLLIALIVILVAYAVLIVRQMLIIAMILVAPVAILGWIFPSNTKLWSLWRSVFTKLLLMYPLIMLVIAAGQVLAVIISQDIGGEAQGLENILLPIMIVLAYTLPYAFVPFAFKFVGGTLGRIAGMANATEGGLFKRIRGKAADVRGDYSAGKKNWNKQKRQMRAARLDGKKHGSTEGSVWGEKLPTGKNIDAARQRRQSFNEAKEAYFSTNAAKMDPAIQAGHMKDEKSKFEAQAATINAADTIAEAIEDRIRNHGESTDEARKNALNIVMHGGYEDGAGQWQQVRDDGGFIGRLKEGKVSQAEFTGTASAFAMQKAGKQLHEMQDAIATMSPGTPEAENATAMWSGMLGNSNAYAAVTKISPALGKTGVAPGMRKVDLQRGRFENMLGEANEKLMDATADSWTDAFEYAQSAGPGEVDRLAKKFEGIYKQGGEAAVKVDPGSFKKQPGDPDKFADVLKTKGIL